MAAVSSSYWEDYLFPKIIPGIFLVNRNDHRALEPLASVVHHAYQLTLSVDEHRTIDAFPC